MNQTTTHPPAPSTAPRSTAPRLTALSTTAPRRGFTLVEVMLSLLLVLLLLVGVNVVFDVTSTTVRAGQALNEVTRGGRGVQPIFFNDFRDCAQDSPAFVITSSIVPQYLNSADAKSPVVLPTNGCTLSGHLHRCDMVMFFARGAFRRKTADSPYLVSGNAADEAYVHYGHLRPVSGDGVTHLGPEDASQTTGPFAAEWVLGRNVILAEDPTVQASVTNAANAAEIAYAPQGTAPAPFANAASNVTPFGYGALDSAGATAVQNSRYDVAKISLDQFRSMVSNAALAQAAELTTASPYYTWWAPLVYNAPLTNTNAIAANPPVLTAPVLTPPAKFARFRFDAGGVLGPTPLLSTDVSGLSPFLLEHVSQFVVEFAGDFVTEDAAGAVTDTIPDGQIDYYIDAGGNKQVRWYGMPRDTTGAGVVPGNTGGVLNNAMTGVVPLRDVWASAAPVSPNVLHGPTLNPYEVEPNALPAVADYASAAAGMSVANARYTAVWRNDVPAMVRILFKVDDPNNSLQEGPWFEYVFKLK